MPTLEVRISNQRNLQTSKSVTVLIVDTGTLGTSSQDVGPDGVSHSRILDLRPGPAQTLGYGCDDHAMVSSVRTGHGTFPGGNICWQS